ncbi:MAG: hypothetical protein LBG61_01285 [Burkholderiales bacterium]|jgi:hypothetical protein|nr:hypothetical protein [Burkholderiales bacterium]
MKLANIFGVIGVFFMLALSGQAVCAENMYATGSSSTVSDTFAPNDKALLNQAFIDAANRYLTRYNPKLVEQKDNSVKMFVVYRYDMDLEFSHKDNTYTITASTADHSSGRRADKLCKKLTVNINKRLRRNLAKVTTQNNDADDDDDEPSPDGKK